MTLDDIDFTQVEYRILHLTADGQCHSVEEMLKCLEDEFADKITLKNTLAKLRPKLVRIGQEIIPQSFGRRVEYRRVIPLPVFASISGT